MNNYYTSKQIKELFSISSLTLLRWRKSNKIPYIQLTSRKIVYPKQEIDKLLNKNDDFQKLNVIYCRVSTNNQKNDLLKQKQLLLDYCSTNGIIVDEVFSEIASGMNDNRKELNKLINLVLKCKVKNLYITYKDRLTRFGFDFYKNIFSQLGCSITVINNPVNEESLEQELTEDLISIIHHFSMKMYSNRRKKLKEIAKELESRSDLNE